MFDGVELSSQHELAGPKSHGRESHRASKVVLGETKEGKSTRHLN